MKTISLTQGQFALVDDKWHDILIKWKWHARWDKTTNSYYAMRTENGKKVLMHRVIMDTPTGMLCDHKSHNTLDNQEENLRNVTPSQSVMNRRKQTNNKTGIPGVGQRKGSKKYRAYLAFEGKMVLDKVCETIEDAILVRSAAEKKYFGEYANHDMS